MTEAGAPCSAGAAAGDAPVGEGLLAAFAAAAERGRLERRGAPPGVAVLRFAPRF
jgi:hypothetical protein